ncbi:MAG: sodium:proton antiporter [Gluconacetobacter diazotrophicus]|nr:sodium:proton antiporter [Gluconacetobacter diazotrophicus]
MLSVLLLQLVRRIALPYPTVLAAAGVAIALLPGTPTIAIEPATSLMVFVAPALLDAAYDFPLDTARRFWWPLLILAVAGVLLTAAAVAVLGHLAAGLPMAAAVALGAIVAPPDAAAATAVLRRVSIPRNSEAVLKGESLFNDATALLLFGGALAVQEHGGLGAGEAVRLVLAVPGGVLFGIVCARLWVVLSRRLSGTLGGVLMQFVGTMLVWDAAQRLQLSAVLALVAYAMTLARGPTQNSQPHVRVHSYAVWATVVFVLNVLAFLLMGMQARGILDRFPPARLHGALWFAGAVVGCVIAVRVLVAQGSVQLRNRLRRRAGLPIAATAAQGMLVGWCGMRGLVTLAAAFALPADFPERDLITLSAFAVVLATLVIQGATLVPLVRLLGIGRDLDPDAELGAARASLAEAVLERLDGETGEEATQIGHPYRLARDRHLGVIDDEPARRLRSLGQEAIGVARQRLEQLRAEHAIGADSYDTLLSELDWRELSLLPDAERRIEEA